MTPDVSVVVEWDNSALAGSERARQALAGLATEANASSRRLEILLCYGEDAAPQSEGAGDGLPAGCRMLRVPGGRYYELKNHGVAAAKGALVAFLDSDAVPGPGWLNALLEPFSDPAVQVVAGHTHLETDTLWSKAFALWWFFPLRGGPEPLKPVAHFFANNVAFRRQTMLAHPFPVREDTSRGGCVELAAELSRAGITIWKTTEARVSHPAPRGWRHFVLRALAQGRDRLARESGWRATLLGSIDRLARFTGATLIRTVRGRRQVVLPPTQVPAAVALGWLYYTLYFAGELATLARLPAIRRVRV
jgi:hypothetical protein